MPCVILIVTNLFMRESILYFHYLILFHLPAARSFPATILFVLYRHDRRARTFWDVDMNGARLRRCVQSIDRCTTVAAVGPATKTATVNFMIVRIPVPAAVTAHSRLLGP